MDLMYFYTFTPNFLWTAQLFVDSDGKGATSCHMGTSHMANTVLIHNER